MTITAPASTDLFTIARIRDIEQAAIATLPPGTLMQRAGAAAARKVRDISRRDGRRIDVLFLAGPGNNGGDALEAAAVLKRGGARVRAMLHGDPARQPRDAAAAHARALQAGVEILPLAEWEAQLRQPGNLVVDGLFGIGLQRPLEGAIAQVTQAVNRLVETQRLPILALDVPSGLDADTGAIVGGGIAIRASHTLTFIGDKPGLHTANGRDHAGEVSVACLDIPAADLPDPDGMLSHPGLFASYLRRRAQNTHKGSFGDVVLLGGAPGMAGAIVLAARAAVHAGAGRTYAAFIGPAPLFDDAHPELMCRTAHEIDLARKVVVAGPGMGDSDAARAALTAALRSPSPAVFDADALNLLAADAGLMQQLQSRAGQHASMITPHPLEAARLLGISAADVQADRVHAAQSLAERTGATVILKGSGSIIAAPGQPFVINTTGNPALATGGTGDVLTGLCGSLLAQGWPAREAAIGAAWIHGRAADDLVSQGIGPIGMTASELVPALRHCLNRLVAEQGTYA